MSIGKIKKDISLLINIIKNLKYFTLQSLLVYVLSRLLNKKFCKIKVKPKILNGKAIYLYIRPNSTDICAVLEVLCENIYLKHKDILENKYVKILDIGAHIGTFTVLAHHFFKPKNIIAVEPDDENIRVLKMNLNVNGIKNVKIFNNAISSKRGKTELYIRKEGKGPIRTTVLRDNIIIVKQVESVTLDDLIVKYGVDLIKMDCEGAEFQAIFSSKMIKNIKAIVMEYHKWGGDEEELIKYLSKQGFSVIDVVKGHETGLIYLIRKNVNNDLHPYCNQPWRSACRT